MTASGFRRLLAGSLVLVLIASTLAVAQREDRRARARVVALRGTVVDLYSYMTGQGAAAARSDEEQLKMTRDSIKNGVPACIESEDGVAILGKGPKAPIELVLPLATREVEVRGKLYKKDGLQFIDIVSIKALKENREEETVEEEPSGDETVEVEDVEPETEEP